jgi:hypothetical protein
LAGQLEAALQLGEQNHIAQGGQAPREGEGASAAAEEFSRLLEQLKQAVLWIRNNYFELAVFRIHRIHVFFGLPDPDPPDLRFFWPPGSGSTSQRYVYGSSSGSGSIKQNSKKNLDSYCFVTFLDFLSLQNYVKYGNFKSNKQKIFF